MNRKVLIIWLWTRWQEYIRFFQAYDYRVFWVCSSQESQQIISQKYNIFVSLEIPQRVHEYDIIIIALPTMIQSKIAFRILDSWYVGKIIIETPVTWDKNELKRLQRYKNVIFFLEEYYTLLSLFFRKISPKEIKDMFIQIYMYSWELSNTLSQKVSLMHIIHNFPWWGYKDIEKKYTFIGHDRETIYYTVSFLYKSKRVLYRFHDEKYLQIGNKILYDDFCFDKILNQLIIEPDDLKQYYIL